MSWIHQEVDGNFSILMGKLRIFPYIYQTTTMKNHGFFSFFFKTGISMGISLQVDDIDGKASSNWSKVPAKLVGPVDRRFIYHYLSHYFVGISTDFNYPRWCSIYSIHSMFVEGWIKLWKQTWKLGVSPQWPRNRPWFPRFFSHQST